MKRSRLFLLIVVFAVLLLTNAASAALDLGVDEITLEPGGFYEFTPQDGTVYWYVSDESIIELGGEESIGVRALQPGTAVVFAMSEDHIETDFCVVTVSGEAKAVKSGDLYYQELTAEDLAKVKDPAIAAVLSLASNTAAFPMGIGDLSGQGFKVLFTVKEGSAQKIADAAEAMGLADAWAYEYVSMAALKGDANDIARLLVEYRDDIVSVETDREYSVDSLENDGISGLRESAEVLTEMKVAHALGYTGEGQYIAIIDTGIADYHVEFEDENGYSRVAYQHCYSSSSAADEGKTTITQNGVKKNVYTVVNPVCGGDNQEDHTEAERAEPINAQYKSYFTHGTHVAGIAAGRNGVAPDANIIAVQAFTEKIYYGLDEAGTEPDYNNVVGSASTMYASDELKAMDFILKLQEESVVPAALNLSYGHGAYSGYASYHADEILQKFLDAGTIPCAATGNNEYNGYITIPAASKKTFAVGALWDDNTPTVAVYSNHSNLVDILAPGTNIWSSVYDTGNADAYAWNAGTSMATPMVSGAFALLKQLNPEGTAQELEKQIVDMTGKTAARAGFTKPVLNFANFSKFALPEPFYTSDYDVAGGDGTITVTTYALETSDDPYTFAGYKVELCKSDGAVVQTQYAVTDQERELIFSRLANNTLYKVKVYGYIEISGTKYYSDCGITPMVPLAAPTGLTLTTAGAGSVKAVWTNHPNDKIKVEYSEDRDFATPVECTGTGSCTVTGLETEKTYYFRFSSIRTYDENDYDSPMSAVISYIIPAEPVLGTDYTIGTNNRIINVSLKKNSDYTGYKVDIYNAAGNLVGSRTVGAGNDSTAAFSGLANDTLYYVRVAGYRWVNGTNYFSAAETNTKAVPMEAPNGLNLTASDANSVAVKWPNRDAETIEVSYSESQTGPFNVFGEKAAGPCEVTELKQNTTYYFRVRRYNETLKYYSPYSVVYTYRIPSEPVYNTDYTIANNNRTVYVDLYPKTEIYNGYKVDIYNSDTPEKLVSSRTVWVTNKTTLNFSGLANDTAYYVRVSGFKNVNGVNYFSLSETKTKVVPMEAPYGLTLSATTNSVTVTWPKQGTNPMSVEYSDNQNDSYKEFCDREAGPCEVTGLEQNKTYYFRVRKYNAALDYYSPYSTVSIYRIPSIPTDADYTVSTNNRAVIVTLKANTAYYDGYKVDIYNSNADGSIAKLVGTRTVGVTNNPVMVTYSGLTNDSAYYIKVSGYKTVNRVNYFSAYTTEKKAVPMEAPYGLNLSASTNSVTVTWPKRETETIEVEYSTGQNGPFTVFGEKKAGPYEVSGLDQNKTYYFRVRRYNETLEYYSPYSVVYTYRIPSVPVVEEHYTIGTNNRAILVDLKPNTDIYSGYKVDIYLPTETSNTGRLVSTRTAWVTNKTTFNFSGLANDTAYYVKVSGFKNVNGVNYFSAYTTEAKAVPMEAPYGLTLSATTDSVTVTWPKQGTNPMSVEYSDNQSSSYKEACGKVTGPCKVTELKQDTTYYFRVRKYNAALEYYSPYSTVYTYRIPSEPKSGTDYTVRNGDRAIFVDLEPNDYYTGYKVDIYNSASPDKLVATRTVGVTRDTTVTFYGLVNDTVYNVKVSGYKWVNGVNYFSTSETVTKMAPMAVPTGLKLTVSVDSITAEWENHPNDKIKVEYATAQNGQYNTVCEMKEGPCKLENLPKNTVYYLRFSRYNAACACYSPVSAVSTAMTIAKPVTDDPTVGYRKIRVYFDDAPSLTGHQIKTYIKSTGRLVSTVNVWRNNNPTYADITNLTNDTEYRFEIRSFANVSGTTFYSDVVEVSATPKLKPLAEDGPKNVKAAGGAQRITVSWDKDLWTGGHYIEVYRIDNKVMVANAYAWNNATSYTFAGGRIEYNVPYMIRVWKYNETSPRATGDNYVDTYAASLATPGSFNAVTGDKSIDVSWTYSGIADSVDVYYSTAYNGEYYFGCTVMENDSNTCTIENLNNDTLYYVKANAAYTYIDEDEKPWDTVTSDWTQVRSAVPLPVLKNAVVTTESKTVKVQYAKDPNVDGHIIQLYQINNGRANLVRNFTSNDKDENVTISFTGLANGATYRVTICSYKRIGWTTYRGAIATYTDVTPSENASSASKALAGVSDLGEAFDGFVDPIDELNEQSETEKAIETAEVVEVVEVEEERSSIFDLFRLW